MDAYLGEIRIFAGFYAPDGWALCQGQALPIAGNEALYSLIGSMYGGDGRINFNLPNLSGALMVGQGAGVGLTPRTISQKGGADQVTLTSPQATHTHSFNVTNTDATTETFGGVLAATTGKDVHYLPNQTTGAAARTFNSNSITSTGSNMPHNNDMPTMPLNYIICVQGIYPDRP